MKALFISDDPHIFERGSAARARMRAYAEAIGELHILARAPEGAREEQDGSLFLHPVRASKLFAPLALSQGARALIRTRGIEVVSAQDPFEHGWAAARAVSGTGAKLHLQVHTDFLSPYFAKESFLNRIRVRIADSVLPRAQGIRVVSERIKESLMRRYGSTVSEPAVLPIVPPEGTATTEPFPKHDFSFVLCAVGRLEREKRVKDVLQTLARVHARYPATGLFIIGAGREERALRAEVRNLGLQHAVVFLGARENATRLIGGANAFIQASAYEGYGRTFIEAARARVPIVSTDVGIIGEVLRPEEEALVCPVGDIACLSRQVTRLIEDNALRDNLSRAEERAAKDHQALFHDIPSRIAEDLSKTLQK